jgi:hypothetical protein
MDQIASILTSYFFILILLFATCNFIGSILLKLIKSNNSYSNFYLTIFRNTLLGSITLIVIISLIYTGGKTISLAIILISVFIFLEDRLFHQKEIIQSTNLQKPEFNLKIIGSSMLLILIVFLIQAYIVFDFKSQSINPFPKDSIYYAELSKCLIHSGQENTFAMSNFINNKYHFPTPYHYFDLWFNGFIANLFNLNYSLCLYLITYCFFTGIFLFGLMGCFENLGLMKWKYKITAFLLLFIGGLNISENQFHMYSYCSQMEGLLERYGNKLNIVYGITLFTIISFVLHKNKRNSLIILLIIPIVSISLAPAIYLGTALYSFYYVIANNDRKFHVRLNIYILSLLVFIGLFYYLNKLNDLNYRLDRNIFSYTDLTEFTWHRIKFYIVELLLKSYIIPFLFLTNYFPLILIIIWLFLKKQIQPPYKSILFLFSIILSVGILFRSSLYLMDDAYQLYTNTLSLWHVLFAFSFILLLSYLNNTNANYTLFGVVIITLSLIFNCYSSLTSYKKEDKNDIKFSIKYISEINNECDKLKENINGVTFFDSTFFNNTAIQYPYEYYCMPPVISSKLYVPYNLTSKNRVPILNNYQLEKTVKRSPYNQYLSEKTNGKSFKDSLSNQIDFIKENGIKYLICPKSLDVNFKKYFNIKIEIRDSLSGQRFLILN